MAKMNTNIISDGTLPLEGCTPIPTLFIIGNGFDIAHEIESKYSDFRKFEIKRGNQRFVDLMDIFFSNQTDFWSDIETALGQYDEDSIIDFCNPEEEFDIDHPTRSESAYADSPDFIFHPLLEDLKAEFRNWVNDIDISIAERIIRLSEDAQYLTFNYTDTLETIYNIPMQNVFHIHGARNNVHDEYIVGHSNLRDKDTAFDDDDVYFKQETRAKVIGWMNDVYKDADAIIYRQDKYFNSLKGIQQVIVLGHSLNDVDLPYFKRIIKETGNDVVWKFSYYGKRDIDNINRFIAVTGLTNTKVVPFDDFVIED